MTPGPSVQRRKGGVASAGVGEAVGNPAAAIQAAARVVRLGAAVHLARKGCADARGRMPAPAGPPRRRSFCSPCSPLPAMTWWWQRKRSVNASVSSALVAYPRRPGSSKRPSARAGRPVQRRRTGGTVGAAAPPFRLVGPGAGLGGLVLGERVARVRPVAIERERPDAAGAVGAVGRRRRAELGERGVERAPGRNRPPARRSPSASAWRAQAAASRPGVGRRGADHGEREQPADPVGARDQHAGRAVRRREVAAEHEMPERGGEPGVLPPALAGARAPRRSAPAARLPRRRRRRAARGATGSRRARGSCRRSRAPARRSCGQPSPVRGDHRRSGGRGKRTCSLAWRARCPAVETRTELREAHRCVHGIKPFCICDRIAAGRRAGLRAVESVGRLDHQLAPAGPGMTGGTRGIRPVGPSECAAPAATPAAMPPARGRAGLPCAGRAAPRRRDQRAPSGRAVGQSDGAVRQQLGAS